MLPDLQWKAQYVNILCANLPNPHYELLILEYRIYLKVVVVVLRNWNAAFTFQNLIKCTCWGMKSCSVVQHYIQDKSSKTLRALVQPTTIYTIFIYMSLVRSTSSEIRTNLGSLFLVIFFLVSYLTS